MRELKVDDQYAYGTKFTFYEDGTYKREALGDKVIYWTMKDSKLMYRDKPEEQWKLFFGRENPEMDIEFSKKVGAWHEENLFYKALDEKLESE